MKKVTIEDVMSWYPCSIYPRERIKKLMGRKKYVTLDDIWKAKLDCKRDYLWLVFREEFITEHNLHKIAIYTAKLVLPLFEKEHPNDKRLRQAIEAKKKWLRGEISDGKLRIARYAVANAVRAVAWTTEKEAAKDAAWAAWAASCAVSDTAWAAARAVDNNIYNKIIKYIKRITK
jgi:hypothetical protein